MPDPADPVVGPDDRHHLARVLRLRVGERVVATDGAGRWAMCRVTADPRMLEREGPVVVEAAPSPALTVAFAPVKGERPEWVVQKLTEMGIDRIVVVSSARSVVRWDGARAVPAMQRLGRVATEASAQSRRVWMPELLGPLPLARLGEVGAPATEVAYAEPGGGPLTPTLRTVVVGPEGGWTADELAAAPATVGLGPHVLRAETAALVAGALLVAQRTGTVGVAGQ